MSRCIKAWWNWDIGPASESNPLSDNFSKILRLDHHNRLCQGHLKIPLKCHIVPLRLSVIQSGFRPMLKGHGGKSRSESFWKRKDEQSYSSPLRTSNLGIISETSSLENIKYTRHDQNIPVSHKNPIFHHYLIKWWSIRDKQYEIHLCQFVVLKKRSLCFQWTAVWLQAQLDGTFKRRRITNYY